MRNLIKRGFISQEEADYLKNCMASNIALVVTGNPNSGKTALVNALTSSENYKILTVEQAKEIMKNSSNISNPFSIRMKERSKVVIENITTRKDCKNVLWLIDNNWSFILSLPTTGSWVYNFIDFFSDTEVSEVSAKLSQQLCVQIRLGFDEKGVTKVTQIS